MRQLTIAEAKQIAGRAGRFGTVYSNGEVTCFHPKDLKVLASIFSSETPQITEAGIFPTAEQLELFCHGHRALTKKNTLNFGELISGFEEMAKLDKNFFFCNYDDMLEIAFLLQNLILNIHDMYTFCMSPADTRDSFVMSYLLRFATDYTLESYIPFTLEIPAKIAAEHLQNQLRQLESMHRVMDLYLWLGQHFKGFKDLEICLLQREKVEQMISVILFLQISFVPLFLAVVNIFLDL